MMKFRKIKLIRFEQIKKIEINKNNNYKNGFKLKRSYYNKFKIYL